MLKCDDRSKSKISFKCLEYMSLGICFLTSSIGIPKEIKDYENAIFVEQTNQWYEKLSTVLSSSDNLPLLGKNARSLLEIVYNYEKNSKVLKEILFLEQK
jgi:glycosyltransferase involved in cell wall biosynthesis